MAKDRSVVETALELDVSVRQVQRWIKDGLFPGAYKQKPGGVTSPYRIPAVDLDTFRKKQRQGQ